MSSLNAERLYALLPAVYRIRDEQQGHPLRALVALIAQEFEALDENIEQLYDDQFIETCDAWVAPYIGDLIGYRPLHGVAVAIASPRAEVANTIAYRRRKGTAAMLEQLARDVTEWPARAVEFFEQLATTQYMNHVRLHAPATADLRSTSRMLQLGGAFNAVAHTAEMRRPEAGSGRYNIPNVGIFLWRWQPFRLSDVPLVPDPGDATGQKFCMNPLGADLRLFRLPETETVISHIAEPANVPEPLRIRELALQFHEAQDTTDVVAETQDYGAGHSFVLRRAGAVVPINRPGPPVPPGDPPSPAIPDLRIADLRDILDGGGAVIGWAHEASVLADEIFIDPERGRVLLGSTRAAEHAANRFFGSFHYGFSRHGFSRPIGGGEYERSLVGELLVTQRSAGQSEALQPHLDAIASGGRLIINDSLTYTQTPVFKVDGVTTPGASGLEVVVTARNGARPLIAVTGPITLNIGARGRLVLDGLVISGSALQLAAAADHEPRELVLRHCTLVPGLNLNPDGSAASPDGVSLIVAYPFATVRLEQCIVGALQVDTDAQVDLVDCIVDAGSLEAIAFEGTAPGGPGIAPGGPGAEMTIQDSTVIGKLHVRIMRLASNTIFFARLAAADTWKAPLWVERKQEGCVRFSFVPVGSLVPKRFRCGPDDKHPDALPHFTSLRYGDPGYAQLRGATDKSIRVGADDGGEIAEMIPAAFPDSVFPRERNLRVKRWDQKHKVLQTRAGGTTSVFQDLDATSSTGVIKVPAAGTTLLLENGVTVNFATTGADGFRAGDFWVFAARTADASVELLANEPPRGIHHHYARLGIWDVAAGTVTDCRTPWPPRGEGHDCGCTECVTSQSHASGQFTIQAAVDRVRDTGGTVCLGVGQFQLKEPVLLNGARAVRIRGQGAATLVMTPGGAFSISSGIALAIEDLAILSLGRASAISVRTVLGLSLQRLIIAVFGGIVGGLRGLRVDTDVQNDASGAAITLAGAVIGATIRDNAIIAPVAVQAIDPAAAPPTLLVTVAPPPQMLMSAALRIEDNVLWCEQQAVSLTGRVIHTMATRITSNEILGSRLGAINALGLCGPGASMHISSNSLNVSGLGITAAVDGLWIEGNMLVSTPQHANRQPNGAGITLRTGLDPSGADQCQILSNQISGFAGAAIAIQSPTRELIVKLNIIERCGNGIISEDEAKSASVSIENNHISDIGGADDARTGYRGRHRRFACRRGHGSRQHHPPHRPEGGARAAACRHCGGQRATPARQRQTTSAM